MYLNLQSNEKKALQKYTNRAASVKHIAYFFVLLGSLSRVLTGPSTPTLKKTRYQAGWKRGPALEKGWVPQQLNAAPRITAAAAQLHVHLVIKSLKYLKSIQQPTPTQRRSIPLFFGRGPWSQIWRSWPSSQPLHIWLQTSPVHAEGHWRFCWHRTLILIPKILNKWFLYTSSCSLSMRSRKPWQCVTADSESALWGGVWTKRENTAYMWDAPKMYVCGQTFCNDAGIHQQTGKLQN